MSGGKQCCFCFKLESGIVIIAIIQIIEFITLLINTYKDMMTIDIFGPYISSLGIMVLVWIITLVWNR